MPASTTSNVVLCLHGYLQNANLFRVKSGAFKKILKKRKLICHFENAPFIVWLDCEKRSHICIDDEFDSPFPDWKQVWISKYKAIFPLLSSLTASDRELIATSSEQPLRGWWTRNDVFHTGLCASVEYCFHLLQNIDFHMCVGFSQGTTVLLLLQRIFQESYPILSFSPYFPSLEYLKRDGCAREISRTDLLGLETDISHKIATYDPKSIVCEGKESCFPPSPFFLTPKSSISPILSNCLVIVGSDDKVINPDDCASYVKEIIGNEVIWHKMGHFIPTTKEMKEIYLSHIDKIRSEYFHG
ncbi:hypothetical protein ADUPG1_009891 [Aduncisulcus paluster]|uniref:Serine hydrolase domain-containing protein n=1 Tax=Aduncisulcus paluster TaxID=2918883 RepID=A0ABQ5KZX1_9EUKA|nr:hypothetical protein ADUPG1_009891 [Aduncisulcus paluster]